MKLHTDKHGLHETWQIRVLQTWLCDERSDSDYVYHTGMVEQLVIDLFLPAISDP